MKTNLTLFCSLFSWWLFAQVPIPSPSGPITEGPCLFDSTQIIFKSGDWQYYQTLNDEWDGPLDTTWCISLSKIGNKTVLRLSEIDAEKPLFVRLSLPSDQGIPLLSNALYILNSSFRVNGATVNDSINCQNDQCSGVQLFVVIPNDGNTGTVRRVHKKQFRVFGRSFRAEHCLPTEYFSKNEVVEIVLKLSFIEVTSSDAYIEYLSIWLDEVFEPYEFIEDTLYANETINNKYRYSWWYPFIHVLGFDPADGYPEPGNESPTFVYPPTNTTQQDTIEVVVEPPQTLIPQPFTQFLGGQVAGQDSVRHVVNLINNGGAMCFSILDLVFEENTNLVYRSGQIEFSDHFSCIQFRNGGKLIVADNAHLELGAGGQGLLALREGGSIVIGKNSSLTIDNRMIMNEHNSHQPRQIFMELNEGSTLRFGPNASLSNRYSINEEMRLNVFMNGGVLDDEQLSPKEHQLIRRIYPKPAQKFKDNIRFYPNPGEGSPTLRFHAEQAGELLLRVYRQDGQLLVEQALAVEKGIAHYSLNWSLPSGVYFVEAIEENQQTVERLAVLR